MPPKPLYEFGASIFYVPRYSYTPRPSKSASCVLENLNVRHHDSETKMQYFSTLRPLSSLEPRDSVRERGGGVAGGKTMYRKTSTFRSSYVIYDMIRQRDNGLRPTEITEQTMTTECTNNVRTRFSWRGTRRTYNWRILCPP